MSLSALHGPDYNSPLWVVTSYYNPMNYHRRLANYRAFRKHLQVPLLAVELSGSGQFQLADGDGEIVMQLTGEDRIWQKERLINLGVRALPKHVKYVAWVDCDLLFVSPDWHLRAMDQLEAEGGVVQLFSRAFHSQPDYLQVLAEDKSVLCEDYIASNYLFLESSIAPALDGKEFRLSRSQGSLRGRNIARFIEEAPPAQGLAWAACRSFFEKAGLYDCSIVGGGDDFLMAGLSGTVADLSQSYEHSKAHAEHAAAWGRKCDQLTATERRLSNIHTDIIHLWHGSFDNRRYLERQALLEGFDPTYHLCESESGAWAWRFPNSILAASLAAYFEGRKEDGDQANCGSAMPSVETNLKEAINL